MGEPGKKEKQTKAVTTGGATELLTRWDDWDRMFDRMVEELRRRTFPSFRLGGRWWPTGAISMGTPVVDMFEEKDAMVVKAELPGLSKDEVEVHVTNSTLTLKGEKKKKEEVKEEDYHCSERFHGVFVRTLELPSEVKTDQVKATFKDGVLEIRLPKTEEAKQKTVTVKIE